MTMQRYLPEGLRLASPENREACASLASLERAMNMGLILEGVATMCDHSLCLHVDVGGFEGIIPYEEAVLSPEQEALGVLLSPHDDAVVKAAVTKLENMIDQPDEPDQPVDELPEEELPEEELPEEETPEEDSSEENADA